MPKERSKTALGHAGARALSSRPDRLLDVHEAAQLLSVQPTTMYQWAYQRRIPTVKLMGRALRFRESDLQKLIAQGFRPTLGHGRS
jgi:excisionase family DNA binding protein